MQRPFLEVSCPTVSFDAQRTEAMGLALGALLLAVLPPGQVTVEGDSKYVIGLWNKEWEVRDVFLFNCVQVAFDVTKNWQRRGNWIPRT